MTGFTMAAKPAGQTLAMATAVLLCSCSSITPDQTLALIDLATAAATLGTQVWISTHPAQKESFRQTVVALKTVDLADPATSDDEKVSAFVKRLDSLPTASLVDTNKAELYWSGRSVKAPTVPSVTIWDVKKEKAIKVQGEDRLPVLKAVVKGINRGLIPLPPKPGARPLSDAQMDAQFQAIKARLEKATNVVHLP